jgi:PAS domain S-box-containing protein
MSKQTLLDRLFPNRGSKKDWERIKELLEKIDHMQRQLRRYKEFWDCAREAFILVKAPSGIIIDANPSACALYGYSKEKIITMSLYELSAEVEGTKEVWKSRCEFVPFRYHQNSDGTKILISASVTYFTDNGNGDIVAIIVRPIAEHRGKEGSPSDRSVKSKED